MKLERKMKSWKNIRRSCTRKSNNCWLRARFIRKRWKMITSKSRNWKGKSRKIQGKMKRKLKENKRLRLNRMRKRKLKISKLFSSKSPFQKQRRFLNKIRWNIAKPCKNWKLKSNKMRVVFNRFRKIWNLRFSLC